jgi:hypothetical protein
LFFSSLGNDTTHAGAVGIGTTNAVVLLVSFVIASSILFHGLGSTNKGPYHRIIDPTVDLLDVYNAHSQLPWLSKLWHAIKDKAPPGK